MTQEAKKEKRSHWTIICFAWKMNTKLLLLPLMTVISITWLDKERGKSSVDWVISRWIYQSICSILTWQLWGICFQFLFFFHLFVYFRCSERIKTNEEKKKENGIVCAVEANDLVTSEWKASHIENFQCDSSKIDDDDERSGTIEKKYSTDVEDE